GDVSAWSFQESKTLSAGEGGFNMCRTKDLFYRLYSLRNCGRPYEAQPPVFGLNKPVGFDKTLQSGNYRLTEFQAAMLLGGLKRLDDQVKLRDKNAQYLNAQLAEIPGVLPMRRRREVSQQSYFNFAFRLDMQALKVTNRQFCAALNAELHTGDAFEPPYDPLSHCSLFKPRTKRRHRLGNEYWKAVDPRRYKIPVCREATDRSGVVVHHVLLMHTTRDMDEVAAAVKKLVDNIDEVRKLDTGNQKKHQALSR
ncbi:MAG TPA: L-glutamine:2-deoxy-scyllo-inosose aminotransferase, partial [Candidatus Hydrogenedentes bacterium]|nr:L-glutamine:2-deoxy-scyllo-inosose aminotransferase [Candidatus Hydrogenedentota bacterium]